MRLMTIARIAGLLATPGAGFCEGAADDGGFTRKRAKPPLAGERRITVQIDSAEQARRLAACPDVKKRAVATALDPVTKPDRALPPSLAPVPVPAASCAWFREKVPIDIAARDGRFPLAVATLSQGPGGAAVMAPRMQQIQELAPKYGTDILMARIGTEVPPPWCWR
jgi:hypothetical protein